jgi:hypothetical protein
MLAASRERIESELPGDALVLDVGAGASPFSRADWVLDILPYGSRGRYGELEPSAERFDESTWVVRDICDREPWPFEADQFDLAVCSHTLEDVRDPVWVCSELIRVARAGYLEVPSRLEEQSYRVLGDFVGWPHHRWIVDVGEDSVDFVFKPHMLPIEDGYFFPAGFVDSLSAEERVQRLFWEGDFAYRERIFTRPDEFRAYLMDFVTAELAARRVRRRVHPLRAAARWARARGRARA